VARAIVQIGKEQVQVEGRTAEMVLYLAANAARVNVPQKGNVRFDFADAEITPSINAIDAPLHVGARQLGQ